MQQSSGPVVYEDAITTIQRVLRHHITSSDLTSISIKSLRADLQRRGFKAGREYENSWLRATVDELLAEHQRAASKAPEAPPQLSQSPGKRGASPARDGVGNGSRKAPRQTEPRPHGAESSSETAAATACVGSGGDCGNKDAVRHGVNGDAGASRHAGRGQS